MTTIEEIKDFVKSEGDYCDWDDILQHFNGKHIYQEMYDKSRWYTNYEYVGKFGDKYFRMYRGLGSTEYQEDEEMTEAIQTLKEVEPYEVIVVKYRPLNEN